MHQGNATAPYESVHSPAVEHAEVYVSIMETTNHDSDVGQGHKLGPVVNYTPLKDLHHDPVGLGTLKAC